jgi:hypothetical protein
MKNISITLLPSATPVVKSLRPIPRLKEGSGPPSSTGFKPFLGPLIKCVLRRLSTIYPLQGILCYNLYFCRLHSKCDVTRAETKFRLSAKRTSPFKLAGASVQSSTGSRGVHIGGSIAGYTTFQGSVRVLATHSICQIPLHFPSCTSLCAITFQMDSTTFTARVSFTHSLITSLCTMLVSKVTLHS